MKTVKDVTNWGNNHVPYVLIKPTLEGKWKWKLRLGVWSCQLSPINDYLRWARGYRAHLKDGQVVLTSRPRQARYYCGKLSPQVHGDLLHAILFYGQ